MAWDSLGSRSVKKTMATTGSAPTLADDGIAIDVATGFSVFAEADSGQTLTGTGSLFCYVYDRVFAAWIRAPALDMTISNVSGQRRLAFPSLEVFARRGRIVYITNALAVSSGSVTVYLLCTDKWDRDI